MSRSDSSRFPVTVTRLPVTRCEICGRTLAYRPGQASSVLTQHYNRMHPEVLAGPPETARLPGFPHLRRGAPAAFMIAVLAATAARLGTFKAQ
jgi:hypothetical protein